MRYDCGISNLQAFGMSSLNKKSHQISVYANYRRIDKVNVDVAKTLCARDYKGFGTGFDTQNGVIEYGQGIDTDDSE